MDNTTEKGRQLGTDFDNILNTGLKLASGMKGLNRIRVLTQAREDLVKYAGQMDLTEKQAQGVDRMLAKLDKAGAQPEIKEKGAAETGKKVDDVQGKTDKLGATTATPRMIAEDLASGKIDVVEGLMRALDAREARPRIIAVDMASGVINHIKDMLDGIPPYRETTIHTKYTTSGNSKLGAQPAATGGHIRGAGGPTEDLIPIMASDNEFVMRAAAVDKYGPAMMHEINALRFAQGGLVQQRLAPQRMAPASGSSSQRVTFDPARVDIATPWGTQTVELIARQAARAEVDSAADFERRLSRR